MKKHLVTEKSINIASILFIIESINNLALTYPCENELILPRKNGEQVKPHFQSHNIYVLSHQESTNYLPSAS